MFKKLLYRIFSKEINAYCVSACLASNSKKIGELETENSRLHKQMKHERNLFDSEKRDYMKDRFSEYEWIKYFNRCGYALLQVGSFVIDEKFTDMTNRRNPYIYLGKWDAIKSADRKEIVWREAQWKLIQTEVADYLYNKMIHAGMDTDILPLTVYDFCMEFAKDHTISIRGTSWSRYNG